MATNKPSTGVAFSGGGIRSAALCSGVLRRLLQRGVEPDHLSCVSGGGYTGTAYVDWKYRHEQKDDPSWHKRFFEHMRIRAGLLCDWQRPLQGVLDTFLITGLILIVTVATPIAVWGCHACPIAFCVDFFAGDILRADISHRCPPTPQAQPGEVNVESPCVTREKNKLFSMRAPLFATLFALYILFYICTQLIDFLSGLTQLLSSLFGLAFAFTFLPWFIHNFLDNAYGLVKLAIIAISVVLWFFAPVLRRKASLFLVVYTFAYVVCWRVYKGIVVGVEYSDGTFSLLLLISALVLCAAPWIGGFQQNLFHVYNRWRLQRAFYSPESTGKWGCTGIGCKECYPGVTACIPPERRKHPLPFDQAGSLCLGDLEGMKPQYICNIVVNEWEASEQDAATFDLLTMTPTDIQRITSEPGSSEFSEKLTPCDVQLSDAMATSAAAVSRNMGAYQESTKSVKHIQTILGLGMGASMISDLASEKREGSCVKLLPYILEAVRVLPLVVCLAIHFSGVGGPWVVPCGVFTFLVVFVLFTAAAVGKTGSQDPPGRLESITRWLLVHVPFCRYMRELLGIINTGPVPPAILRLSDGGHIENLALLPLLKRRLQRIVVVNGGYTVPDSSYGDDLVHALELAREKLGCSFLGANGRDVLSDINCEFVNKDEQPRYFRFKVQYSNEEKGEANEGHILFIAPRHPRKGPKGQSVTWPEVLRDIDTNLDENTWGPGPYLQSEEVDRLTFCCCESCHARPCSGLSEVLCGAFPHHVTSNQFFTPAMFSAYHREGYRACLEASAGDFLKGTSPNPES